MSTAEVITFPSQQAIEPPKEVRVADCDNGYTRIANELYDAVLAADLTVRQLKIVMAIIRKTYGFNKKVDRISDEQISLITGIHRTHICNARLELIERKILVREGLKIGVNKVVSEWAEQAKKTSNVANSATENQNSYSVANSATNNVAETATEGVPKQLHTKDNIKTKDNKILKDITPAAQKSSGKSQTSSSAKQTITDLDFSTWPAMPSEQVMADWIAHRKAKKATITQTVINNFGSQLTIAAKHGISVDECLSECMTRNWQGLKAEWLLKDRNQRSVSNQIIRQNGFTLDSNQPGCIVGKI